MVGKNRKIIEVPSRGERGFFLKELGILRAFTGMRLFPLDGRIKRVLVHAGGR